MKPTIKYPLTLTLCLILCLIGSISIIVMTDCTPTMSHCMKRAIWAGDQYGDDVRVAFGYMAEDGGIDFNKAHVQAYKEDVWYQCVETKHFRYMMPGKRHPFAVITSFSMKEYRERVKRFLKR